MDAFAQILADLAHHAGFGADEVHTGAGAQVPGFYRPSKQWDLVAVRGDQLCAAVELKSMAGSYRNNLNSRTEEALGSAADVRAAHDRGMLGIQPPWLGYLFVMREEDVSVARRPAPAAVLPTDPVFAETSHVDRYGTLCERMVQEGLYTSAAFLTAPLGDAGEYAEPREALRFSQFARSFHEHLLAC